MRPAEDGKVYGLYLSRIARTLCRSERLAMEDGWRVVGVQHLVAALRADPHVRSILRLCSVDVPDDRGPYATLPETGGFDGMDITPGVRRILETARDEAETSGERHIRSEYVLLAALTVGKEAGSRPAWFPYVGCVAAREERAALSELAARIEDVERVRAVIAGMPRRTLLRAAEAADHDLLRPAAGTGADTNLLHIDELHDSEIDKENDE